MVLFYTLTSMLSAFLVFMIQPVVAKIALPTLGGIPAVWNGCMLFFQAMLLLGYLYAHVLSGNVRAKHQPFVHLVVLLIALTVFPMGFNAADGMDPVHSPLAWLLTMLLYSVGLPFFAISASAPLLQKWFSHTGHKDAHNPYFLYAASNVGSMGALLLYPFAIEPFLPLMEQVRWWEHGVMALFVLFITVAYFLYRNVRPAVEVEPALATSAGGSAEGAVDDSPVTWGRRFYWVLLSFVPASLLYGVTTYVSTDIAAVPLLWIIPLSLYLITFILVFAKKPKGIDLALELHFPFLLLLLILVGMKYHAHTAILFFHIVVFFIVTLAIHGVLARSKPTTRHLTEFFLWMSFGGVLGGIFNTLVAPHLFNSVAEYPLALILSCLLRADPRNMWGQLRQHGKVVLLVACAVISAVFFINYWVDGYASGLPHKDIGWERYVVVPIATIMGYMSYRYFKSYPASFALCMALLVVGIGQVTKQKEGTLLMQERSLFGVNKVTSVEQGRFHLFIHGTTLHGVQSQEEETRLNPVSYYTVLKEVFANAPKSVEMMPVSLIGLGVGTIACYGKPGQLFDMYEIDPLVQEIAENTEYFSYMQDCPPEKQVILGDARQKVKEQQKGKYGIMIMDAFSSDAVPTHLITKEAVVLYLDKLAPDGLIAFHISNRHIELRSVLAAIADELGLAGVSAVHEPKEGEEWVFPSVWVILARSKESLQALENERIGWEMLPKGDSRYLWTDDFSNILFSLKAIHRLLGREFGNEKIEDAKVDGG